MRELIPGLGEKTTRKRLDELFSREVLGSILLGLSIGKVIEKFNTVIAVILILLIMGVDISSSTWVIAGVLLSIWVLETVIFVSMYIKWEKWEKALQDKAEKSKEKAEKVKEKKDEVKEKAKGNSDE